MQVWGRMPESSEVLHAASELVCLCMCGYPPTSTVTLGIFLQDFLEAFMTIP